VEGQENNGAALEHRYPHKEEELESNRQEAESKRGEMVLTHLSGSPGSRHDRLTEKEEEWHMWRRGDEYALSFYLMIHYMFPGRAPHLCTRGPSTGVTKGGVRGNEIGQDDHDNVHVLGT